MKNDPNVAILLGVVGAAITIVGWVVIHRLRRSRDREAREHATDTARDKGKVEFISFMAEWRSEAERSFAGAHFANLYKAKINLCRAEAALIRPVFMSWQHAKFDGLMNALCDLSPSEIYKEGGQNEKTGRTIALEAIDALVLFVKSS